MTQILTTQISSRFMNHAKTIGVASRQEMEPRSSCTRTWQISCYTTDYMPCAESIKEDCPSHCLQGKGCFGGAYGDFFMNKLWPRPCLCLSSPYGQRSTRSLPTHSFIPRAGSLVSGWDQLQFDPPHQRSTPLRLAWVEPESIEPAPHQISFVTTPTIQPLSR